MSGKHFQDPISMQNFGGRGWHGPGGPADLIAMYHTEGSIFC